MAEPTIGQEILITRILEAPRAAVFRAWTDPDEMAGGTARRASMRMTEPTILRVEFHDHGDRTRVTLSDGPHPGGRGQGAEAGWQAALDALALRIGG